MTKTELQEHNDALIALLTSLRDQIDEGFDDLGITPDDDESCDDDNGDD